MPRLVADGPGRCDFLNLRQTPQESKECLGLSQRAPGVASPEFPSNSAGLEGMPRLVAQRPGRSAFLNLQFNSAGIEGMPRLVAERPGRCEFLYLC